MRLPTEFVRLPYRFDVEQLKRDVLAFDGLVRLPHYRFDVEQLKREVLAFDGLERLPN